MGLTPIAWGGLRRATSSLSPARSIVEPVHVIHGDCESASAESTSCVAPASPVCRTLTRMGWMMARASGTLEGHSPEDGQHGGRAYGSVGLSRHRACLMCSSLRAAADDAVNSLHCHTGLSSAPTARPEVAMPRAAFRSNDASNCRVASRRGAAQNESNPEHHEQQVKSTVTELRYRIVWPMLMSSRPLVTATDSSATRSHIDARRGICTRPSPLGPGPRGSLGRPRTRWADQLADTPTLHVVRQPPPR